MRSELIASLRAPRARKTAAVFGATVLAYILVLKGDVPPFGVIVLSGVIGLTYSMLAIGLLLVYRANRVLNFAQGEMGAAPALLGVLLIKLEGWPYFLALGVTIVAAALIGFLAEVGFVRRFARAPRLVLMIATIGIGLLLAILQAVVPGWFGVALSGFGGSRTMDSSPPETPFRGLAFSITGVRFNGDVLAIVVVAAAAAIGLTLFFRRSQVGIAIRASAENADRAWLMGIPVRRLSTIVWMIASVLSAVAIFTQSAVTGVRIGVSVGPTALIYGLAAAIFARMESFPRAIVGGVGVGVLTQSIYYVYNDPFLPGAVAIPVLLIVLLMQRGRLSRGEEAGLADYQTREFRPIPPELRRLPEVAWGKLGFAAVAVLALIFVPFALDIGKKELATVTMIYAIVCVSLVILTGWSGQISLGQWGLAGVGAFMAGWFGAHLHADFFLTLIVSGFAGAAASLIIGLPALRIRGPFLAATTLAFAISVHVFLLAPRYFGSFLPDDLNPVARPLLYGRFSVAGPLAYYYLTAGFLLAALASASMLRRTRAGRAIIAMRDNSRSAQSYGINSARVKIAAFAISGFWAALAGALFVFHQGAVDQPSFDPVHSITLLTIVVIGGATSLPGAMVGAAYLGVLRYGGLGSQAQALATGLGVLVLLMVAPGGVAQGFYAARDGLLRWVAKRRAIVVPSLVADKRSATLEEARRGEVRDVPLVPTGAGS